MGGPSHGRLERKPPMRLRTINLPDAGASSKVTMRSGVDLCRGLCVIDTLTPLRTPFTFVALNVETRTSAQSRSFATFDSTAALWRDAREESTITTVTN